MQRRSNPAGDFGHGCVHIVWYTSVWAGLQGPGLSGVCSAMARPVVIQTEHLDDEAARWLAERCDVIALGLGQAGFNDAMARADAAVVRTYTRVDGAFLARGPRLRVVGRAGVGLDNIDLDACRARGVVVVSTPDANTSAVIEYVTAWMLDATRPRLFLDGALPAERWNALRAELRAPRQLCELTLGIWGLGRIGSGVARVARALGMTVIYHDLLHIPVPVRSGAEPVSRAELCQRADILTVHVDGRPGNAGLVGPEDFDLMKPGVVFMNTSRGFVIDGPALARFMAAHPGAMALLDVHEPEPFGPGYGLLGVPNVKLSPHIASATAMAQRNMSWVVRDIWRVLTGQEPMHQA
ncbi:MAG: hypothetical protein C0475_04155 [Planctomyces sp.]|nr:hypothetical protein [Planctomyces sp.]MBA4039118.1 hypothetical protein [Planctomyces sp.]